MKKHYTKLSFLFLAVLFFSANIYAQKTDKLWTKTSTLEVLNEDLSFRKSEPRKAEYFQLDLNELQQDLVAAPARGLSTNKVSNVIVNFPNSKGELEAFRVMEASIMAPELQAMYPSIKSYSGQSIDNPTKTIRFSVTPKGLHAMMLSGESGMEFIDPYTNDGNTYISYSKRDLPNLENDFICHFDDSGIVMPEDEGFDMATLRNANDGMMREFRLAVATTIEYSEFHWTAAGYTNTDSQAVRRTAVMDAIVVTMTRVNAIYERDLSITMTLIGNNSSIVFINSDSFDNDNAGTLIGQSQSVINAAIGSANYDIGHTFSTGGGGLASLNSPCQSASKARGITGSPAPVGDAYDVDYVAHEMGHQFGAPHTFNGNADNCAGGNRTASNAYEPGSGTTIMAYAGICAPQNVQSNSDAYFHQKSLQMIWDNITPGGAVSNSICGAQTATGNSAPTANAGGDYIIPISTPYKLTGSSTDAPADGTATHTYTWEQWDLGTAGVPNEATATGPLVRSFEGTTNPTRYIPNIPSILQSGTAVEWEVLSAVSRAINFSLTVRDNDSRGGQTANDNMLVTTTANAGPFFITSQTADQIVWTPGSMESITWDVAGTTANGVNTANVNILLSTDNGLTYDTVLAANTPNDGSEMITVPNITAPYCRIMIEAVGNIFFAINDKFLAVGNYTYGPIDVCEDYVFNAGVSVVENAASYTGYGLTVNDSFTITDFDMNVNITASDNGDIYYGWRHPSEAAGVHQLASGICTGSADIDLTFDDEGSAVNCASTNNGDNVLPQVPMSDADGLDSAGQWVFFITDINVGDGNIATWNSATLTLCRSEIGPILGVDEFSLEESFIVYPNPNNGEFNIKLKSRSNQDINVEVFDIRGRSVLNKTYTNNGDFNQSINLSDVQSGMYLINVNDGERKATKKIIIN